MVIRTESSLEIRVAFTIILKHPEPDGVTIKVAHRDLEGWIVGVTICERSYIWYYYDSYWYRYASQWKQIYCFAIENQVYNVNFLIKFRYQVVVWKGMSKKAPIFEDSGNLSSKFLRSNLVLAAEIKLELLMLKGLFKKNTCIWTQNECYFVILPQVTNEWRIFVLNGTAFIRTWFPEALSWIAALKIPDSLLLRLRKLFIWKLYRHRLQMALCLPILGKWSHTSVNIFHHTPFLSSYWWSVFLYLVFWFFTLGVRFSRVYFFVWICLIKRYYVQSGYLLRFCGVLRDWAVYSLFSF